MPSKQLQEAIDEYLTSRAPVTARGTLDNDRHTLAFFVAAVGNIQTGNLTTEHGERFMAYLAKRGLQASTLSMHWMRTRVFVGWLQSRGYIKHFADPMATSRRPKAQKKVRQRIPVTDFPRLLDAAPTPRLRVVVALGLYTFVRASEMKILRLEDVSLDESLMIVRQPKTGKEDEMPICSELYLELRSWLSYYSSYTPRPLRPENHLVPALSSNRDVDEKKRFTTSQGHLVPEVGVSQPAQLVKRVLLAAGYDTKDRWGKPLYEGVHTLRRSGARALYDHLVEDRGYDGAIRTIQAMLHHDSVSTTEIYLGLDLDIKKRNDLLRGKPMFTPATDNVVRLQERA